MSAEKRARVSKRRRLRSKYPHSIKWSSLICLIEKGELLVDKEGQIYKVKQLIRAPIKGVEPTLVIEKLNEDGS